MVLLNESGGLFVEPDGRRTLAAIRQRRDRIENPKHRAMVEVVLQHLECEIVDFDIDKLMATLVDEPVYHTRGGRFARDEVLVVRGRAAVRKTYTDLMAAPGGFPPFEIKVDHFLVDDDGVYFDGQLSMVWPGVTLQAFGHRPEDPDARYLETVWTGQMMPFVGGLMRGEDLCYGPSRLTKLGDRPAS